MHLSRDLEVSERYSFSDFPKYITKIIATPVKHLLTKISMLNFFCNVQKTLKLLNGFIAFIIVMQTQKKHLLLTSILNIYLGSHFVLRSNCMIIDCFGFLLMDTLYKINLQDLNVWHIHSWPYYVPSLIDSKTITLRIGHTQTGSEWLYTLFIFLNIAKYHD